MRAEYLVRAIEILENYSEYDQEVVFEHDQVFLGHGVDPVDLEDEDLAELENELGFQWDEDIEAWTY